MYIVGRVQVSLASTTTFIENKKSEQKIVALVMTG
jgi:hypothetical protein